MKKSEWKKRVEIVMEKDKEGEKEKKVNDTLYSSVLHYSSAESKTAATTTKGNTKAKLTAVAVKPNFLKKDFKDLNLLPLGAEGRGKTFTGYILQRLF